MCGSVDGFFLAFVVARFSWKWKLEAYAVYIYYNYAVFYQGFNHFHNVLNVFEINGPFGMRCLCMKITIDKNTSLAFRMVK